MVLYCAQTKSLHPENRSKDEKYNKIVWFLRDLALTEIINIVSIHHSAINFECVSKQNIRTPRINITISGVFTGGQGDQSPPAHRLYISLIYYIITCNISRSPNSSYPIVLKIGIICNMYYIIDVIALFADLQLFTGILRVIECSMNWSFSHCYQE